VPLFFPQNNFALANLLIVHPQAVFESAGICTWTRWATLQLATRGRLKDIRLKGTSIGVEFNFQICRVRKPDHLVGRTNHDNFGYDTDKD